MVGRCLLAEVLCTLNPSIISDHPKCEDIVVAYENQIIGGLYKSKIIKSSSQKVAAVAYERWLFTRDSRCRALTGPNFGVLQLWSPMGGGRLRQLVAHAEVRLNIQL